jgi:hypothetical protein
MKMLLSELRQLIREAMLREASGGRLVVVDVQPEYADKIGFDVGDLLRTAATDYSSVLFLWNGPDLGMCSKDELKGYYFEALDYDDEVVEKLFSVAEFYDKAGRRGGKLTFVVKVTDFFDAEGNKVAEARMTGVETERPPEEG